MIRRPPRSTLFPYTTSSDLPMRKLALTVALALPLLVMTACGGGGSITATARFTDVADLAPHAPVMMADVKRSEEHTSELQSRRDLVCRLLLEKKKNTTQI